MICRLTSRLTTVLSILRSRIIAYNIPGDFSLVQPSFFLFSFHETGRQENKVSLLPSFEIVDDVKRCSKIIISC